MPYAGFWRRVAAIILDTLVLTAVDVLIDTLFYGTPLRCGTMQRWTYQNQHWSQAAGYACNTGGWWSFFTYWLYFTLLESSAWQATLGKKALRLAVTDEEGNRIGFGKANARYWSKILSTLILGIGFLMVAFTRRKQGLHDMIARTLVVRR